MGIRVPGGVDMPLASQTIPNSLAIGLAFLGALYLVSWRLNPGDRRKGGWRAE
jgi:hypothetical protein